MSVKTEAYFCNHCDHENCDLGSFDYICPCCDQYCMDYVVWWKQDDIWGGEIVFFVCDGCDAALQVEWDKDEHEYYVTAASHDADKFSPDEK